MSEQLTGTAREFGGRAESAAGRIIGDTKTQAEGAYNQVAGQAEQAAGQMSDMIKEQPLTAALIALGVGYIIGRLS